MAIIGVRKLKEETAAIIRQVEAGEAAIITRHGRPVAAITPLTEDDLEDWVLAHHPEARRRIQEGIAAIERGEGMSLKELKSDWGLED